MENDLFETIRQHYNGIDVKRLKKRANGAKNEAASRLGLIPPIPFIEWWRIMNTPEYKKEIAYIYTQISSCEKYVADDLQTIINERAERSAEMQDFFINFLVWLNKWCKEYHELVEGTEYDLQPMQAATDTAAALPDRQPMQAAKPTNPKILENPEIADLFERLTVAGYCSKDGALYRWDIEKGKALWAYMVDEASDAKHLRPSNDRIPWSLFAQAFTNVDKAFIDYAKATVSKYGDIDEYKPKGWQELQIIILS